MSRSSQDSAPFRGRSGGPTTPWPWLLSGLCGVLAFAPTALAEGSAEFDLGDGFGNVANDQALDNEAVFSADVIDGSNERICWTGTGNLTVNRPDGTTLVGTLTGTGAHNPPLNVRCVNTVTGVNGAYRLVLGAEQVVGTEWDVRVCTRAVTSSACLSTASNEQKGRLWSYRWDFARSSTTGSSYTDANSINGSVYAIVPGGGVGHDAVMEMQMNGVSGFWYELAANSIGPETAAMVRVGRSVAKAGHQITPEFPLYLSPPAVAGYNWIVPTVTNVQLEASCGSGIVTGTASGEIKFTSNVVGQYVVICDVDKDSVYDFANPDDFSSFGDAVVGSNMVTWDGTVNGGGTASAGTYNCIVRLNVGEFHYIADDIETSYEGIRMYRVNSNKTTRVARPMFWDDSAVQTADTMPNGQVSPASPPPNGLTPSAYGTAAAPFYFAGGMTPTGNARAWGNFANGGKGNDAYLDTFASADTATSPAIPVSVVAGNADNDSDGLLGSRECVIGSDPADPDSDGDGVIDGFEAAGMGPAIDTDSDMLFDVIDPDDDGDGVLTKDEGADPNDNGNPNDAVDTDGNGGPDYLDTDSDNDGVLDGTDGARTDATKCRDADDDLCDDCANTGANGSGGNTANDGLDTDGDMQCDKGDDDDDGDGVDDPDDADPLDANACSDSDLDGCDDCAVTGADGSGGDPADDGADADGDGTCDLGEVDTDGDGVGDVVDADPDDPHVCVDRDKDSCDDCAVTGDDGSQGDPDNDGTDTDGDGICDAGETDDDGDGVRDGNDNHPRDPNRCRDRDKDGCDDCSVTGADGSGGDPNDDGTDENGDGICDSAQTSDGDRDGLPDDVDRDADNDGIYDDAEGTQDTDGDGKGNYLDLDADGDGVNDIVEAGGAAFDVDGDGRIDDVQDDDARFGGDGLDDRLQGKGNALPRPDTDDDKKPDFLDDDDDDDTRKTAVELADAKTFASLGGDVDADGTPNYLDTDSDDDGVSDRTENEGDGDGNGDSVPDYLQAGGTNADTDGDGLADSVECPRMPCTDTDRDGKPDFEDPDDDGDSVPTIQERQGGDTDTDSDGTPDYLDTDDDNDTLPTNAERPNGVDRDTDKDGTLDRLDPDDDQDGIPTAKEVADGLKFAMEAGEDADGDGALNYRDTDSDGDTILDADESTDADDNGVPDYLEDQRGFAGGACAATRTGDGGPASAIALLLAAAGLLLRRRRGDLRLP